MVSDIPGPSQGTITGIDARRSDARPAPANTAAPPAADSSVQLTDEGGQLSVLEAAVHKVPAVDRQRVDALRQSVGNGSYQIDASRVAEKLLALESRLPG